ncbi:unnamed protein product [Calicophoron daubneyi]|uniref:Transcriptional adapter 2-beta n=1 Tax=Calicophoron daubneyi TaxID=300641 RepID=A0AAV2TGZ8_CALDB
MQAKSPKCSYCLRRIGGPCLACLECPSVRLCPKCFACGVEGGDHKRCHGYTVEQAAIRVPDTVFTCVNAWSTTEELRLLEGLDTYGYGNWNEIAVHLPSRSALECKQHYEQYYMSGLIGKSSRESCTHCIAHVDDHTNERSEPTLDVKPPQNPEAEKLLGYVASRDEFEYDYCNDAERYIVAVPYSPTLDGLEKDLQLTMIDIYNERLKQRELRHYVAREHGLVNYLLCHITRIGRTGKSAHLNWQRPHRVRQRSARFLRRGRWSSKCTNIYRCVSSMNNNDSEKDKLMMCPVTPPDTTLFSVRTMRKCPEFNRLYGYSTTPQLSVDDSKSFFTSSSSSVSAERLSSIKDDHSTYIDALVSPRLFESGKSICDRLPVNPVGVTPDHSSSVAHRSSSFPGYSHSESSTNSDTADSGIGSSESSGQSTASNGSGSNDSCTVSRLDTSVAHPTQFKRPRSNSDSTSGPLFCGETHLPSTAVPRRRLFSVGSMPVGGCSFSAVDLRTHLVPPSVSHPDVQLSTPPSSNPVIKRKRGRPPRNPPNAQVFEPVRMLASQHIGVEDYILDFPWLKSFLRYLSRREAKELSANLKRENQVRSELDQLCAYHQRGVRCMQDVRLQPVPCTPAEVVFDPSPSVRHPKRTPNYRLKRTFRKKPTKKGRRDGRRLAALRQLRLNGKFAGSAFYSNAQKANMQLAEMNSSCRKYPQRLLKV